MRKYLVPTMWSVAAVLSLVVFGLIPRAEALEPRVMHVVRCAADSPAGRCDVVADRSFDAAGLSQREVRRQTRARHMANEVEMIAASTLKDMELLNCGKITREEYLERRSGPSGADIRHKPGPAEAACDFGDPDCANCWTYFQAPGWNYCTYACVNCQGTTDAGEKRTRMHR